MTGRVCLVGAGPGDPELLTQKAARILGRADVVLYDRLVHPDVLNLVGPNAVQKCVGKAPGGGWSQQAINHELILWAQRVSLVVRLKGGDPFVFGRGGEEAKALYQAGIPVDIIPGLSSAWAAPALAGVPLTYRGVSASVVMVEGHDPNRLEWSFLGKTRATLVIFMAMNTVEMIVQQLMAHGKDGRTPAAIIEQASWPEQRVIKTVLQDLTPSIQRNKLSNPAVIVVGDVANVLPLPAVLREPVVESFRPE